MRKLRALACSALCLLAAPALAGSVLEGAVTHVRDGDTIEVEGVPVRLSGLHAPEMHEDRGSTARDFMINLVAGQQVRCELTGARSYDREIGICYLGSTDIAAELVKAGLGRDCPRFSMGRYQEHEDPRLRDLMPLPDYCWPR